MKIHIFLVSTIIYCFIAFVPSFANDNIIGYVDSLSGIWVDHRYEKKPLSPLSSIRADSEIKSETSRADYFISIRIYGLASPKDYSCSTPMVCANTLDLRDALNERDQQTLSTFQRVINTFKSILVEPPSVWAKPIERAGSIDGVQDDVVIVEAEGITVDKLFFSKMTPH